MEIIITELTYNLLDLIPVSYGSKLRGCFANRFENILFHQHKKNGALRYDYPLIQYKIISGNPYIIGINNGAHKIIDKFLEIETLNLNDKIYNDIQGNLSTKSFDLFVDDHNIYDYVFPNPWIALNQKNYREYKNSTDKEKDELLRKILIGNILSFAAGINWHIEKQLLIFNLDLEEVIVNYKNNKLIAFKGSFKSNVYLPSNIGLGKSVSKGFGRIIRKG
jgi:hypothetical protein